jgi:hypothetical protein
LQQPIALIVPSNDGKTPVYNVRVDREFWRSGVAFDFAPA